MPDREARPSPVPDRAVPGVRLLAAALVLLGVIVRLAHLLLIDLDLPYRGGGLFAVFARQIAAGDYALPARIAHYTEGGIPYAYPPLPFWIAAALLDLGGLSEITVINLLPPLIAALTVPSFWLLVRALRLKPLTGLAALLAFAVMPVAFAEQVEGSGLAEGAGTLAVTLLGIALAHAHQRPTLAAYGLLGLAGAFNALAAPGTALAAPVILAAFGLAELVRAAPGERPRRAGWLALAALVALAGSAPYWLAVLDQHGLDLFTRSTGGQTPPLATVASFLIKTITVQVAGARYFILWDALIAAGALHAALTRRWVPVTWLLFYLAIPREGTWMAAVPAAILAGIGAAEFIAPPMLDRWQRLHATTPRTARWLGRALAVGLAVYVILTPAYTILANAQANESDGVTAGDIAALDWARAHTPPESRWLVLANWDVIDWAPALAGRTVLNMPFGAEWEPGENERIEELLPLVLDDCRGFDCLWESLHTTGFTGYTTVYLFIEADRWPDLACGPQERTRFEPLFSNADASLGTLSLSD